MQRTGGSPTKKIRGMLEGPAKTMITLLAEIRSGLILLIAPLESPKTMITLLAENRSRVIRLVVSPGLLPKMMITPQVENRSEEIILGEHLKMMITQIAPNRREEIIPTGTILLIRGTHATLLRTSDKNHMNNRSPNSTRERDNNCSLFSRYNNMKSYKTAFPL